MTDALHQPQPLPPLLPGQTPIGYQPMYAPPPTAHYPQVPAMQAYTMPAAPQQQVLDPPIIVHCLLERPGGTKVPMGMNTYHFAPNSAGHHVCPVSDYGDYQRLMAISEGYRQYDPATAEQAKQSNFREELPADGPRNAVHPQDYTPQELTAWAEARQINYRDRNHIMRYGTHYFGLQYPDHGMAPVQLLKITAIAEFHHNLAQRQAQIDQQRVAEQRAQLEARHQQQALEMQQGQATQAAINKGAYLPKDQRSDDELLDNLQQRELAEQQALAQQAALQAGTVAPPPPGQPSPGLVAAAMQAQQPAAPPILGPDGVVISRAGLVPPPPPNAPQAPLPTQEQLAAAQQQKQAAAEAQAAEIARAEAEQRALQEAAAKAEAEASKKTTTRKRTTK